MQSYLGIGETFNFQEIETKGEKEFYITGYISTKSIDKFNDVITDECLDDMLVQVKSGSIKIDFEHETIHNDNLDINPVARIVDAKKDNKGLWVKALVNSSHKRFSEIKGSIVKGFLDSFSIAFKPIETATRYIQGKAVRILNKLKLINVGITGTPVNDECKLDNVMVKALMEFDVEDEEIDEDEEFVDLDELSDAEIKAHKYIKRTGNQGNYKYFYREDMKKKESVKDKNPEDGDDSYISYDEWLSENDKKDSLGNKMEYKKQLAELRSNAIKDNREVEKQEKEKPKESGKFTSYFENKEDGMPEFTSSKDKEVFDKEAIGYIKKWKKEGVSTLDIGNRLNYRVGLSGDQLNELLEESLGETIQIRKTKDGFDTERYVSKTEKKALTTQSGLAIGNINHTSQSSSKEGDNRQMENETKPVEQATEVKVEEAKVEEPKVEETKTEVVENTEVKELKEELAEVKAQLVKVQKQLAQPEMKAIQEAMPTTKQKDNVTPLGLIG